MATEPKAQYFLSFFDLPNSVATVNNFSSEITQMSEGYDSKPWFLPIFISELMEQKLSHWRPHESPRQNPSQSYHHYSCKTQVISMYLQQKNLHLYKPLLVLAILWHFPMREKKRKKMLINSFFPQNYLPIHKRNNCFREGYHILQGARDSW